MKCVPTGIVAALVAAGALTPALSPVEGPALSPVEGQSAAPITWPGFRGPSASGVADGQRLPDTWDVKSGQNVAWTSEGTASEDRTPQRWVVMAIDRRTGSVRWQRTAYEGVPREKRHIKATYANATPATDGRHVVAFFGSQGLYAFDMDGTLLWKKDLGVLNTGAYDLPEYEWGTASSPIIYKDLVIVQCDTQNESFVMALDVRSGTTVWKTVRTELPSWGTPTVYVSSKGGPAELVTNSPNFVRGYDPDTGEERWRLGRSSKITAPTPVFADDLIIVSSGRAPERPILAIRPGGQGDITPPANRESGGFLRWSKTARGPYMPTPLIYRGRLYVLANNGLFDAYDLESGREIYRQRVPHQGSGFS